MGILDDLLAGGQRQNEYKDFVNRYEQGDPSEGYSDQEVLKRYGEVSHAVPPDQYAQAAQEALSKLSPEERAAFVKMLQERAAARGERRLTASYAALVEVSRESGSLEQDAHMVVFVHRPHVFDPTAEPTEASRMVHFSEPSLRSSAATRFPPGPLTWTKTRRPPPAIRTAAPDALEKL